MKRLLLLGFGASIILSGCVSNYSSSANGPLERWTNFDGRTISDGKVGDKQSKVVFIREEGVVQGPAVNVFVDGDYLASLLDGGYRSAVVCSSGDRILPSFSRNNRFSDRDTGVDYNFPIGETTYVKIVSDDMGEPIFQRIPEEEGRNLMSSLKKETQTLPRVKDNANCGKAVLKKLTLQIHSLFKFDKSDYKNMLPEGKKEIKELGRNFKNGDYIITDVKVVGYTDPMGENEYNLRLSKRRAEAVKQALINNGVTAPILADGLGKANLLVRDCLAKHKKNRVKRMACDQPNRRVEIILYGSVEAIVK